MRKIIHFELNEVPKKIVDYFCKYRPNSRIADLIGNARYFESYTENKGHLSPWNTWPTLHRGVTNDKHFISDFNQDLSVVDREFPPVWKILAESGKTVGMFGSLHSYPPPAENGNYSFYVPDVFASGSECFPGDVEVFQDFNLRLSRRSSRNVDRRVPVRDAIRLLSRLPDLGIKMSTVLDTGKQLVEEKVNSWKVVRRRTYQTVLSFDVFYKLLNQHKPDYVSFFTNHVASSMHRYWAAAFPDEYENMRYDDEWIGTYDNEILFTMDKADQMIDRLFRFVNRENDFSLVITSSMGQHAVESQPVETQLYITDESKFMKMFGLSENQYEFKPAMLPQFNVVVKREELPRFKKQLDSFKINDKQVGYRENQGEFLSIDLGQSNLKQVDIRIGETCYDLEQSGLSNVEIEDKSSCTAYHIPEGICIAYHPGIKKDSTSLISTTEVLPMLLNNYGIARPEYMAKVKANLFE